jgi:hypothetical protein
MRRGLTCIAMAVLTLGTVSVSRADTIIYGNTAGPGGVGEWDANTGAMIRAIDTPEMTANNGRGVVVVGNIMYYTAATSSSVYAYDLSTNTDLGVKFTVTGSSGLATIAFDGTDLYLGDYSGTNNVYKYSLSGALLQTMPLADCTSYCDGLEYANGSLISNEFDGGEGGTNTYDKYSLTGSLLQHGFITSPAGVAATGIAFDGTDYWVSEIYTHKLAEYDSSGNFLGETTLAGGTPYQLEDLSADYAIVLGQTPEPSSVMLSAMTLAGISVLVIRKRLRAAQRRLQVDARTIHTS